MKVLNIVSVGYRATLEEQDDTVIWLTHMLRRAGADVDLLLRASAAHYVVEGQQVSPLAMGGRAQRNAPDVHGQVRGLAELGVGIFILEEDLDRYGLQERPKLQQARVIGSGALPAFLISYDALWHW